jgi:hypothetical protein
MTARVAIRQSDIARVMRAAKLEGMTGEIDRRSGATFREIAEISGHSESDCEAIIRKHYLAGDAAIDKIENRKL